MGPINPLALEEFEALSERHAFLTEQLDDVKASRRELNKVIRAIDDEIVRVFAAAFADVSENFEQLFATLFPGGQGRLRLTDPDDLLDTGIEIEAKPSGKNVKKLSLLSGGERSLTALAFLFAVFRSRPSPFYVMDEVEAALDDVNLHRFLDLVAEFRQEAQLIIVSHQKRTMEAADCLYGVTMQPGGSSKVVSEKVAAGAYAATPWPCDVLAARPTTVNLQVPGWWGQTVSDPANRRSSAVGATGRLRHHHGDRDPHRRSRRRGPGWNRLRGPRQAASGRRPRAAGRAPASSTRRPSRVDEDRRPGRGRVRRGPRRGRAVATVLEAPPEPEAPAAAPPAVRPRFRDRLAKARGTLGGYLGSIRSRKVDDETWDELEEALIRADVGVGRHAARSSTTSGPPPRPRAITDPEVLLDRLKAELKELLADRRPRPALRARRAQRVAVRRRQRRRQDHHDRQGRPPAARRGPLGGHGRRRHVPGRRGRAARPVGRAHGQPTSCAATRAATRRPVVFDAVERAAARGNDLVLADTAGRLHTKTNLMEELRKVRRVADRDPGNVTEVLLVLDATTGQNGLAQAQQFTEAVDVTGRGAHQARRLGQGRHRARHPGRASASRSSWSAWAKRWMTWWSSIPTSSSRRCSRDRSGDARGR